METPLQRVDAVLARTDLDADDDAPSKAEVIEALYVDLGWEPVRDAMMLILEDPSRPASDWQTMAEAFWGAALDRRELDANRLIALLYKRLPTEPGSEEENNLVWSITSKLKGKSYLSRYNPIEDPDVRRELESVR